MKQSERMTVQLERETYDLIAAEKKRTDIPLRAILRDWIYLAAKIKRRLPEQQKETV